MTVFKFTPWRCSPFLAFILCSLLLATPTQANEVTLHIPEIRTISLANGLRIMVVENHRAPVVSHAITYKVGSVDEKPSERGIAHLLEHMLFRGTPNYSEEQIIRMHQRLGNNRNATTHYDSTRYYHRIQPQSLEEVMAFEAERMQKVIFDEKKFVTERNVVKEERNLRVSNVKSSLLQEETRSLLFRTHPYQHSIIGFHHDINNLTIEKTVAFYREHYRPNNAMVAVVGDVKWQDVVKLAKKYYGPLNNPVSKPSINNAVFFEPPQQGNITQEFVDEKIITNSLSMMWKTPSLASNPKLLSRDDFRIQLITPNAERDISSEDVNRHVFSLMIAATIFSNTSEGLYQTLVEQQRLARHVGAFQISWSRGPGTLGLYIQAADKETSAQELKDALLLATRDNLENLITPRTVKLAKKTFLLSLAYSVDSLKSLSSLMSEMFISEISPEKFKKNIDLFQSISHDDVVATFSHYIKHAPSLTSIVSPPNNESPNSP